MSDLFHEEVSDDFIFSVFNTMTKSSWHQYQILTKRPERLLELNEKLPWAPNIWMGVSVENADYTFRIDHLRETGARIKFISIEPLLGPIAAINLKGISWVIVGGESGPRPRKMEEPWVIDIRNQCERHGVPFFFKQWGGRSKKKAGRILEGRTWNGMPPQSPKLTISHSF